MKFLLPKDRVIVFTHTPKENWSKDGYNPNWIYVNGHTHRKYFLESEEKTIYAGSKAWAHRISGYSVNQKADAVAILAETTDTGSRLVVYFYGHDKDKYVYNAIADFFIVYYLFVNWYFFTLN